MASQTVDDVMATVMSMGFELGDCQEAVQYGKVTVEEIVEWILAGKPGLATMPSEAPRLQLGRQTISGTAPLQMTSNPFVSPIPLQDTTSNLNANSLTNTSEIIDDNVVSRHHLTDEKRRDKELFEEKRREEAKKKAKDEKIAQKKEKERILQQIAEDRDKKKEFSITPSTSSPSKSPRIISGIDSKSQENKISTDNSCTLQIRLPDGRTLRKKFENEAKLNDVWDYVYTEFKSMHNMTFIQPFPRQEYDKDDMMKTLVSLGLTPTGSLVVKPATVTQVTDQPDAMEDVNAQEEEAPMEQGDPIRSRLRPRHMWGQGQRLEGEGEGEGEEQPADDEMVDEDEHDEDFVEFANQNFPQAQFPGIPFMHDDNQPFGGIGQRLLPMGHPDADVVQNRPASQVAAEAALHRFQNPIAQPIPDVSPQPSLVFHNVQSLLNTVFQHLADRLDNPVTPLVSLSGMSEDLAQKLLSYLLKQQILKPNILKAFVPCYIRKLVLDCYPFTTNKLLQTVRLHSNLTLLSLNSCTLITDIGLQSIAGFKKLKNLNLGSCCQLTNRCLNVMKDLPCLQSLNLMKTGVNDSGVICHIIPHCLLLQYLNLSSTNVTHAILPPLRVLVQLRSLFLEETKVCSLSGIQHLPSLQHLNISHTQIFNDSLLCLSQLPGLLSLNIAGTDQMNGDLALQYIAGLKLQNIVLPSRHSTTNQGMAFIIGFPLVCLDLTNYINVGDEGIHHIGKITSLKKLLLGNTKITDHGLSSLKDLKDLEVLNLDRTGITDAGATVLKEFNKLQELSLSATSITSRLLTEGVLNNNHFLSKLNISKTNISDKGISCLKLRSLTLINLEGTRVHSTSIELLKEGCPELQNITLQNLSQVDEVEEDVEEDMVV